MMRTFSFTSLLRTCLAFAAPVVVGFGIASTAPAAAGAVLAMPKPTTTGAANARHVRSSEVNEKVRII